MSSWQNLLIHGDCLEAMRSLLQDFRASVRLIYIDPPFLSGTVYSVRRRHGGNESEAPAVLETKTYSDRWEGGLDEYLEFIHERLLLMRELLSREGSIWVHLDWHVSHYVKVMMDRVFGYSNFVNEIVWRRTNSPKAQSTGFGSQHDTILLYARDASRFRTRPIYRPHDERSLRPYRYEDERGRFRLIEIEAHGIQRSAGRRQFEWRGRTAPYLYRRETLDKWWEEGLIYRSRNGRYSKKQYLSDVKGVTVSDLWVDIPPVQGVSGEYTGFLTQKPEALVMRMIEAATNPDDIVADFFVGSGTTAVAAAKMGRRWIVCDTSPTAVELTVSRLNRLREEGTDVVFDIIRLGE